MKKLLLSFTLLSSVIAFTQEAKDTTTTEESENAKLAKATQNPLAAMYSLPFQNNTTFDNDPFGRPLNVLNIQPVIPVKITEKINLINRVILPVITQPDVFEDKTNTGIGDTSYSAWLSPSKDSKIIWGVGPVFQLPTSSSAEFGSGEWGVGPSIVVLTSINKWVAGLVMNNTRTFGDAKENKYIFQYFANYNLPKAWYVVTAPIISANWNAPSEERWIVPFGGGFGKVFRVGKLPVNLNAHLYYNVDKPTGYGDLQSRFQLQFLFPVKK